MFDHHSSINHTCPAEDTTGPALVPLVSNWTFHHVAVVVAGASAAFTALLSFALILGHATHFAVPAEQRQIIRIIFTLPVFAGISLLAVAYEGAAQYITTLRDLYVAFALAAFFLLLCASISPNEAQREEMLYGEGNLGGYNRSCFAVFQQPVIMLVVLVATDVTEKVGAYCASSDKPQFAHLWLTIIKFVTTAFAIVGVLRFYGSSKRVIGLPKPIFKLVSFKLIVFLNFLQTFIFSFLLQGGHLKPTSHLTYNDIAYGIPALIICLECVIFSILFLVAYPFSQYSHGSGNRVNPPPYENKPSRTYSGGFLGIGALIHALNISDIIGGILTAPGRLLGGS